MPFMQFKDIDLILTSDLQLVPIYRCDPLLSFPTSYAYHKEVHRRGRLFSTERYLRFFHIWTRFVSICLANSPCTNWNGKYILIFHAPFFHLMELLYMTDMSFDKRYFLFLSYMYLIFSSENMLLHMQQELQTSCLLTHSFFFRK